MRYTRVYLDAIGYELAPNVVHSSALEERLGPVYESLKIPPGQIEALTGVRERRYWEPGQSIADGAAKAARKALDKVDLAADDVGMVIHGGVCRDNLEPATACDVANQLGIGGTTIIHDLSNACLGVMNGLFHVANAIEMGQIKAGLVVSCESARQIVDLTIARMLRDREMNVFREALATMTGGSGAICVVLSDGSFSRAGGSGGADGAPNGRHRVVGGVIRSAPQHHALSRWGPDSGVPTSGPQIMITDAVGTLEHGVKLGVETYRAFLPEVVWPESGPDRVICHQVGAGHRIAVLKALGIPVERDFSTFEYLGNIGTVSVPITTAIAAERGFLERGHRVGLFGIGSGLNCLMLGVEW
jgi:3-oxoacyl-[acyl-carrier-protein] synthase-3